MMDQQQDTPPESIESNNMDETKTSKTTGKHPPTVLDAATTKTTTIISSTAPSSSSVASSSSIMFTCCSKSSTADNRLWLIVTLIVVLGVATGGAVLAIGLSAANQDQTDLFHRRAEDLVTQIQRSWNDYVNAAAWIHGRCRNRNFSRSDFRQSYEYLVGSGLDFQAAQFDPNVSRAERTEVEEEARQFYAQNYPDLKYRGIVGFEHDNSTALEPRSEQDYYFPIHYMEPVIGNEAAIDLDYHASGSRKRTVLHCMSQGQPALTDRLRLVQETTESAFGVVLMHPGYNISATSYSYEATAAAAAAAEDNNETITALSLQEEDVWPRDLASIVIRIPDLIRRAVDGRGNSLRVYLYDASDTSTMTTAAADGDHGEDGKTNEPVFLGGAKLIPNYQSMTGTELEFLPELPLSDLMSDIEDSKALYHEEAVEAANKNWIVIVRSVPGTYEPQIAFVALGAVIIFVAALAIAFWMYYNSRRVAEYQAMRSAAEAEKTALIVDNARQATKAERELNDFIAHEVRNPVAAAMSACSFVTMAIEEDEPLRTETQRNETREDVKIIDNALRFVNDLLRNMLDMHRAANRQLKVNMTPTAILHDVLESVHAMLPQRDPKFEIQVECPENLLAMSDRLRLKQVCLNLARNSVKFIQKGFIRLRAEVIDNEVNIFVEDSGPGIPLEKREILFNKFQESLDSLSQGTGIGLFLCKNLVELMDGDIWLDESYDSGVPGNPGTRIVVNLKRPPIDPQTLHGQYASNATNDTEPTEVSNVLDEEESSIPQELPESLSVLFVDDDPILRKLFRRTLQNIAPGWTIREASNGETALCLVETDKFDLIFMDMYMASVEKQLLGSEAVRELRKRGVDCRICGLSANDKEMEFLQAGANSFCFKPFPCDAGALSQELRRILYAEDGVAHVV